MMFRYTLRALLLALLCLTQFSAQSPALAANDRADDRADERTGGPADGETHILVTSFPLWLMARRVAAGVPGVTVELLIPADAGCPHDYGLTPRDMMRLAGADVLIMNGLGLEAFLGQDAAAVAGRMKPGGRVIVSAEGVPDLIRDEDGSGVNPHLFASPRMAARLVRNMGEGLAGAYPRHAGQYRANAAACAAGFDTLADAFAALGPRLARTRIMTQHGDFAYLARDSGLEVVAVVQPHEGQEPSAADLLRLTRLIREKDVGAVFTDAQYPARAGETLARETGVPLAALDSVAGGPAGASPDYYEYVMKNNLHILEQTLGLR